MLGLEIERALDPEQPRIEQPLGRIGEPLHEREQRADRDFSLFVVALAEGRVADLSVGVDQVVRRPILVFVGVPGAHVVVLNDRVAQAELVDRVLDVAGVLLEGELRRLHADDREALAAVGGVPGLQVGERADAVDAGVGPEVDEHHVTAQPAERQRFAPRRVEPVLGAGELGRGPVLFECLCVREQGRPARVRGSRVDRGGGAAAGGRAVGRREAGVTSGDFVQAPGDGR